MNDNEDGVEAEYRAPVHNTEAGCHSFGSNIACSKASH